MTFREARLSLQLVAEERVGFPMRSNLRLAKAQEDAAFNSSRNALTEGRP